MNNLDDQQVELTAIIVPLKKIRFIDSYKLF